MKKDKDADDGSIVMIPDKRLLKNIDKYCSPLLSHKKTQSRTSRSKNKNNENVSETSKGKWQWVSPKMKQFGRERQYKQVLDENSSETIQKQILYDDILIIDYVPKGGSPSNMIYKLTPSDNWYDSINWMTESCHDDDVKAIEDKFAWKKNGKISPMLKKFFCDGYNGESEYSKQQKKKAAVQKKKKKKKTKRKKKGKKDEMDTGRTDEEDDDDEDEDDDDDDEQEQKNKSKQKKRKKNLKYYDFPNGVKIQVWNLFLLCF